jgi:cytochrome o ubiquinol oxidase subunit 1
MTRRMNHYAVPEWHKWLAVALIGALFIAAGIAAMNIQFAFSIRDREANRDLTGDP